MATAWLAKGDRVQIGANTRLAGYAGKTATVCKFRGMGMIGILLDDGQALTINAWELVKLSHAA